MVTLSPEARKALAKVNTLYDGLHRRRTEIERFEAYFAGKHPLAYATNEWRNLHQDRYRNFSDNWCGVVGRAPADRTELIGIRLGDDTEPLSDDERELWRDWEVNDGPAQSYQGFLTRSIAKRSAALVWGDPDTDEPVMTWEHPSQVIVEYDPTTRRRRTTLKAWLEDDKEFATLYTPDSVWKFERNRVAGSVVNGQTASGLVVAGSMGTMGGGWVPRENTGDETWPIPNPLKVPPVVEYMNRPMLGGDPLSDIEGTIAMQDAVNMLWAYLFVAADHASMPARVVMGQEPPKIPLLDSNGQKIGEQPVDIEALTRGRMLWLTGQSTTIGQWDPAKLDVFTQVINVAVRHVAAQTSTPIYLVHGELGNVNGETLTGLDAPLVTKVRSGQRFDQSSVRETFRLLALARGKTDVAEACRTAAVQWANPEIRSDAQVSDAALKDKQVGWAFQSILERRYGLKQTEIDHHVALKEAEADSALLTGVRDAFAPPAPVTDDAAPAAGQ